MIRPNVRVSTLVSLLALPLFACAAPAADLEVGIIRFPAGIEAAGKHLVLNGAGMRKILFIKVYAAGLYLEAPARDAKDVAAAAGPRRVRIGLLRDVSGEDFIEALEEGLEDNLTPEGKAAIADEIARLKTIMKLVGDVKEGDLVDFDYDPAAGTIVRLNGKPVGESIPGKALYDAVLSIWIGEKPIDDDLKPALLGSAN